MQTLCSSLISHNSQLTPLGISITPTTILALPKSLPKLQKLHLSGAHINGAALIFLLTQCPKFTHVEISGNVTAQTFDALIQHANIAPKLKKLRLG